LVIVRLGLDPREIDIMAKLNTDARKKLSTKDFAEPKKRAFPVEDKAHARNAKARASQAADAVTSLSRALCRSWWTAR
jgi:hypothetical protein